MFLDFVSAFFVESFSSLFVEERNILHRNSQMFALPWKEDTK